MRTHTVTVREGELLGPVDWDYDFESHDWDHGGSANPRSVERGVALLRELSDGLERGEAWRARSYGYWDRVVAVGMYDGWPYWRPVPSVLFAGRFGGEWHSFHQVSAARASGVARGS